MRTTISRYTPSADCHCLPWVADTTENVKGPMSSRSPIAAGVGAAHPDSVSATSAMITDPRIDLLKATIGTKRFLMIARRRTQLRRRRPAALRRELVGLLENADHIERRV